MTVQVVATITDLNARHLMVLSNRQKIKTGDLVELAVSEFLGRHPVEGIEHTPLAQLFTNQAVEFDNTPKHPGEPARHSLPTAEHRKAVQSAAEMPKKKVVLPNLGVPLVRRRVRGDATPGHINDAARIDRFSLVTQEGVLQAMISQKVGHTFYPEDLFAHDLWKELDLAGVRHMIRLVQTAALSCSRIHDLGPNSSNKRSFVFLGKKES